MKYPNLELIEYITDNLAIETYDILNNSYYHKFKMYVFPQTWNDTALGFDYKGGFSGQAITEAYTTVVEMSWCYTNKTEEIRGFNFIESEDKIYAVFFDGKIAYMCLNPNSEFLKDFNRMCMKPQRGAEYYVDESLNGEYEYSRVSIL